VTITSPVTFASKKTWLHGEKNLEKYGLSEKTWFYILLLFTSTSTTSSEKTAKNA
jgi:hypothetical protein